MEWSRRPALLDMPTPTSLFQLNLTAIRGERWFRLASVPNAIAWIHRIPSMTKDDCDVITDGVVYALKMFKVPLDARFVALEARLAELEQRPALEYRGVWSADEEYQRGHIVTMGGKNMWHSNIASKGLPPPGPAWTLCVQKGRNGRGGR